MSAYDPKPTLEAGLGKATLPSFCQVDGTGIMTDDIRSWLKELGLGKYAKVFAENEIDFNALQHLDESDFEKLGLPMGPRKRLMQAVSRAEPHTAVTHPASTPQGKPTTKPGALAAERHLVVVMFADLADSTKTTEALGDERSYAFVQSVISEMTGAVHRYAGSVEEFAGDGILALFGTQHEEEDVGLRACSAALDLQERVVARAADFTAEFGIAPRLRVGLHIGSVVVGRVGDDQSMNFKPLGDTVNVAKRLESLAQPGTVAISQDLRDAMAERIEVAPLGEHHLKGKAQAQIVYRLETVHQDMSLFDAAMRRGLSTLVGRSDELAGFAKVWHEAQNGELRRVTITGDPGVGKTRLAYEFSQLARGEGAFVLQGNCRVATRSTPFHPFIEIIRSSFRLSDTDDSSAIERKLSRGLELLGIAQSDAQPYLLNLLGHRVEGMEFSKYNAEIAGRKTRDLIVAMLRERCRFSPVLLMIDDLQWIDVPSAELLQSALDQDLRLLILCTARSPYKWTWGKGETALEILLTPLSREDTETLLCERLERRANPSAIAAIAERADGNPFFAEELASYLVEHAGSRRVAEGAKNAEDEAHFPLPPNVHGLLMNRYEALPEDRRSLLRAAAVFGQRFRFDIAAEASGLVGDWRLASQELEDQGLITPEGDWHVFRHALLQSVVYEKLFDAMRGELHGRIGALLEHRYANALDEIAEDLARHFSEAGNTPKAIRYLGMAGEKALRVYSLAAADYSLRRALELCDQNPDAVDDAFIVDTVLNVARVLYYQADFRGIIDLVDRYMAIAERLGDRRTLMRCKFEIGYAYAFSGDHKKGKPLLEQVWQFGETENDDEAKGFAAEGLLWHHIFWEPPGPETEKKVVAYADQSIESGRRLGEPWLIAKGYAGLAQHNLMMGRVGECRSKARLLFDYSRESGDPRGQVLGLIALAWVCAFTFEWDKAIAHADEALRISLSPIDRLTAEGAKGSALVLAGRPEEGIEYLARVREQIERGGMRLLATGVELPYGVALIGCGRLQAGMDHIRGQKEELRSIGSELSDMFGEIALGEIYMAIALGEAKPDLGNILRNLKFVITEVPGARRKAYRHLSCANEIAEAVGRPSYQAWALYDLGRLDLAVGNASGARDRLTGARTLASSVNADAMVRAIDEVLEPVE
jgi:class 3 adenylate cyclase/tetratricopeptide (TPR) repeat protein